MTEINFQPKKRRIMMNRYRTKVQIAAKLASIGLMTVFFASSGSAQGSGYLVR